MTKSKNGIISHVIIRDVEKIKSCLYDDSVTHDMKLYVLKYIVMNNFEELFFELSYDFFKTVNISYEEDEEDINVFQMSALSGNVKIFKFFYDTYYFCVDDNILYAAVHGVLNHENYDVIKYILDNTDNLKYYPALILATMDANAEIIKLIFEKNVNMKETINKMKNELKQDVYDKYKSFLEKEYREYLKNKLLSV